MGGALLLQGEDRKIHYLPPAICKCRAPASVANEGTCNVKIIKSPLNFMENIKNQIPWDILLLDIEHFLPRRGII